MNEVFGHPWLSQAYTSMPLQTAVPVLTNEIKAYLAASVLDDRKADAQWFQRRIPVIRYLVEGGGDLLRNFEADCGAREGNPSAVARLWHSGHGCGSCWWRSRFHR